MSNKDYEEKDPKEQSGSVDFSDLGPLFAAEPGKEPEETPAAEPIAQQEETAQQEALVSQEEEAETVSFEPEEESVSFEPEPTVDFSDLGPLFRPSDEDVTVVAGASAQVLKRLSELPEEEAQPEAPEDIEESPEEEALLDEILKSDDQEVIPEFLEAREAEEETPEAPASVEESQKEEPEKAPIEAPEEISSKEPETPVQAEEASEDSPAEAEEAKEEAPTEAAEETAEKAEEAPAEEAAPPQEEAPQKTGFKRPQRKGRPKRKKGEGFFGIPNLLVTAVWIAVTVLIGVTLGRMAWLCAADVLAFGREDKPVTITVYEADTIEDITRKLHEGGLIKYPGLFKVYADLAVDEGEIHPGIWDLNTRYDYHALVNMMSPSSSREIIELMIPEGYSCRQIFALMEENKICTSLDLGAYAASGELEDYWFLEGVERGDMYCLEGYLFPDTYQFYKNDSPRSVLTKMLNNFESRFDENMIAQIDSLNAHLADLMRKGGHKEAFIEENKFTVQDVINVASLIEKETSSADEGYVIASVIYNRLFNWPGNVPYLNIDATIVYALGGKNKLTQEDLKVNSPYNTYTHTGLTPGPIANPGLSSIRAALDPSESDYYYYVLDPALGSHRFSTTYDEHKANIASIGD